MALAPSTPVEGCVPCGSEWAKGLETVPLSAPARSVSDCPGGHPTKKGLPTSAAFPIVSSVSDLVLSLCSKPGPNKLLLVSENSS